MQNDGKLGFWGLVALVFGLVVGVGIFNLPRNFSAISGPGGVMICWCIVAAGIMPLVIAFNWLSRTFPQYNAGIYHYAQAGFGSYAGFNVAWGYWLCSAFSNVAYGVMLSDTCGAFFPVLLRHGIWTVLFCSLLIWVMYFIVCSGLKVAGKVNSILAFVKMAMLGFIIVVFALLFKLDLFTVDFWGNGLESGSLTEQVKGTMMIALFCFFGVEGAVMMSSRARRTKDIGKAGIAGFILALVLYLAVSLLCYGVVERAKMAGMANPSVAYILQQTVGEWAYWAVVIGLAVALTGGWVAWTLLVAWVPYEAANAKMLPMWFTHTNRRSMPDYGLFASSIAMECFLLLVVFAEDAYLMALEVTGLMIIPAYLFTGLFLLKKGGRLPMRITAIVIIIFCIWMAWAGGLKQMIMTSVFYLAGVPFYLRTKRENSLPGQPVRYFNTGEKAALLVLTVLSIASTVLLILKI